MSTLQDGELTTRRDPLLAEVVRRLVAAYAPDRIYLFGSEARGDATADSDSDLMMIVPDDAAPAFDRRAHLKASLPGTVLREGRLVHAAAPNLPSSVTHSSTANRPSRRG